MAWVKASLPALSRILPESFSKSGLSPLELSEYRSLARESNAEIYFNQLQVFGRRLQENGKLDMAANVFAEISHHHPNSRHRQEAKTALQSIQGKGDFGSGLERQVSQFVHEATNPRLIFPMIIGTAVGGILRAAALSRLNMLAPKLWTRGFLGRTLAGAAGFGSEVSAFVSASRCIGDSQGRSIANELASATVTLGMLKLSGAASKYIKINYVPQGALSNVGSFLGLLSAHHLQVQWGLQSAARNGELMSSILGSLLSLSAGMRIGQGVLGQGFQSFLGEMASRGNTSPKGSSLKPAWELAGLRPGGLTPNYDLTRKSHDLSFAKSPRLTGGSRTTPAKELALRVEKFIEELEIGNFACFQRLSVEFGELLASPELAKEHKQEIYSALLRNLEVKSNLFRAGGLEDLLLLALEKGGFKKAQNVALWNKWIEASPYLSNIGKQFEHPDLGDAERDGLLKQIENRIAKLPGKRKPHPNEIFSFNGANEAMTDIFKVVGDIFGSKYLGPDRRNAFIKQVKKHFHWEGAVELASQIVLRPDLLRHQRMGLYASLANRAHHKSIHDYGQKAIVRKAFSGLQKLFETKLLPWAEHVYLVDRFSFYGLIDENPDQRLLQQMDRLGLAAIIVDSAHLNEARKAGAFEFIKDSLESPSTEIQLLAQDIAKAIKTDFYRKGILGPLIRSHGPHSFLPKSSIPG